MTAWPLRGAGNAAYSGEATSWLRNSRSCNRKAGAQGTRRLPSHRLQPAQRGQGNLCGDGPGTCPDPLKHPHGWESPREQDLGWPGSWLCQELSGAPAKRLCCGNPCSPGTSAPEQRCQLPTQRGFVPEPRERRSQHAACERIQAESGLVSSEQGARGCPGSRPWGFRANPSPAAPGVRGTAAAGTKSYAWCHPPGWVSPPGTRV